jgi:hypothetical protein
MKKLSAHNELEFDACAGWMANMFNRWLDAPKCNKSRKKIIIAKSLGFCELNLHFSKFHTHIKNLIVYDQTLMLDVTHFNYWSFCQFRWTKTSAEFTDQYYATEMLSSTRACHIFPMQPEVSR